MTGGREHQGSSCRGVGVVRLEPFDPSSGSGRGLLAESSNAEDVRPKATARFDLAFFWIARWCVAFVPGAYPACNLAKVGPHRHAGALCSRRARQRFIVIEHADFRKLARILHRAQVFRVERRPLPGRIDSVGTK